MVYGRPLGRKGVLVLAAVISGSAVLAAGLLWALYLAVTYKPPPSPSWSAGMTCEPGTSAGYHGYIMRCVTPSGQRVEFRDVEWERRTKGLSGPWTRTLASAHRYDAGFQIVERRVDRQRAQVVDKTHSAAEQAALIVLAIAVTVGLQYVGHRVQQWVLSLPKRPAAYIMDYINPACAPGTVPIRQGLGHVCVVGYRP